MIHGKKYAKRMNCLACIWSQQGDPQMCNRQTCSFEEDPQAENRRQWKAREKAMRAAELSDLPW